MEKIPTLYLRDPDTNLRYVTPTVHPDCQWVIDGEGTATYKWNGTAVLIDTYGAMWKRRQVKAGETWPQGWFPSGDPDPVTGKSVGWVPCDRDNSADVWAWEAYDHLTGTGLTAGTYELVGPKINGNPHGGDYHRLIPHGKPPTWWGIDPVIPPTEFDSLASWLHTTTRRDPGFEGIVWWHPDGRRAKIKAKDFPRA